MRYNLISWDLCGNSNGPELITDIWGDKSLAEEMDNMYNKKLITRGILIDYSTKPPTIIKETP